jgi:hypothetical protein
MPPTVARGASRTIWTECPAASVGPQAPDIDTNIHTTATRHAVVWKPRATVIAPSRTYPIRGLHSLRRETVGAEGSRRRGRTISTRGSPGHDIGRHQDAGIGQLLDRRVQVQVPTRGAGRLKSLIVPKDRDQRCDPRSGPGGPQRGGGKRRRGGGAVLCKSQGQARGGDKPRQGWMALPRFSRLLRQPTTTYTPPAAASDFTISLAETGGQQPKWVVDKPWIAHSARWGCGRLCSPCSRRPPGGPRPQVC